MTAGLVVWGIFTLAALAICSDSKRREQAQARSQHPSTYGVPATELDTAHLDVPHVVSASVVPLNCPLCGVTFGHGYLNEHDGKVFGWIEKRHHECSEAGAA